VDDTVRADTTLVLPDAPETHPHQAEEGFAVPLGTDGVASAGRAEAPSLLIIVEPPALHPVHRHELLHLPLKGVHTCTPG
jgi:hypothetical protein